MPDLTRTSAMEPLKSSKTLSRYDEEARLYNEKLKAAQRTKGSEIQLEENAEQTFSHIPSGSQAG